MRKTHTLSTKKHAPHPSNTQVISAPAQDQCTLDSNSAETADALRESQQRFRAVWDCASDAMALSTPDGTVFDANPAYYHLFGLRPADVIGHNFSQIFPLDERTTAQQQYLTIFQQAELIPSFEARVQRADGLPFFVEARYNFLLHRGKRTAMLSIIRDITTQKHLEAEVRQAKQQLEVIFQNVADGISVQDTHGNVVYMNEAGAALCGYSSPAEVLLKPDFQTQRTSTLQRFEIRDEHGNPFPLSELPGMRALHGEINPQAIVQYYDSVSQTRRWSLVKARPIHDAQGRLQLAVTIFSDITDMYKAEQRKDEFISIASHELKTPITSIKGLTQLLRRKLEKQGATEYTPLLTTVETQINRLTRLVNELLDVSKIQAGRLVYAHEAVDLDALVYDIVSTLQLTTTTHTLSIHGASHAIIDGDSDRLGQVFINLISNAIKYSPQSANVDIHLATSQAKATVRVQDYGDGIPKEHLSKIFERFYRAHDYADKVAPGLGMGLFISSEIVKRHGGEITVTSEEGTGSTFTVSLPLLY